jgi:hypothetical protein
VLGTALNRTRDRELLLYEKNQFIGKLEQRKSTFVLVCSSPPVPETACWQEIAREEGGWAEEEEDVFIGHAGFCPWLTIYDMCKAIDKVMVLARGR